MMALLRSNYALAAVVEANDPRLATERLTYPGASGPVKVYLARRKSSEKLPAIIVIHQNRGLNPHIEDFARAIVVGLSVQAARSRLRVWKLWTERPSGVRLPYVRAQAETRKTSSRPLKSAWPSSRSAFQGNPSTRFAMMLRCISTVPA